MEDWSRRNFMRTVDAGLPSLTLVLPGMTPGVKGLGGKDAPRSAGKYIPVDLSQYFNSSSADFGPRRRAKERSRDSALDGLIRTPGGQQIFRGIPFRLGPEGVLQKSWMVLSAMVSLLEEMRHRWMNDYPQKRFILPEEIAALVSYLCKDEACGINGEDIRVTTGAMW